MNKIWLIILSIQLLSCSVSHKMAKQREEKNMDYPFVFIKWDSLFMAGPQPWYYHDYKKKDSSEITNQFARIAVFISQMEISNERYHSFLNSLLKDSLMDLYDACKIQNSAWLRRDSLNPFYDSLSRVYGVSPEFDRYPVVCISYTGMKEYVNWLNRNEPSKNVIYKLPTVDEWLHAFNQNPLNDSTYAWESDVYRNSNKQPLGNFSILDVEQIRYDQVSDDMWFHDFDKEGYLGLINGPEYIYSYNPNNWGAYNMSGNVAEIIDTTNLPGRNNSYFWTKGGSWHSPPYYGRKHAWERYVLPSPYVGFRVVKYELLQE